MAAGLWLAGSVWGAGDPAVAAPPANLTPLVQEIARIAGTISGTTGVAALHLETGRLVTWKGGVSFPMASVYKIPIAVQLLSRADRGEVDLDSLVAIAPTDLRPGSGAIVDLFEAPGVALSLRNLIRASLLVSDNTATDLVLDAAGGPEAVTGRLRALGIDGMRVDRSVLQMLLAVDGAEGAVVDDNFTRERFDAAVDAVPAHRRAEAAWRAFSDVRDSSTPEAMVRLLEMVWSGEALSAESRALLLDVMAECANSRRLLGMLPPDLSDPAHKTGTLWGGGIYLANDAGIVELPNGVGHVAIAVFIKQSEDEIDALEPVIAQIARTVVDGFLLLPAAGSATP